MEEAIGPHSKPQVDRVTEDLVREALKKMKTQKSDAIFDTVSDFYINGPDNLVAHLTALVKLYLQHGSVPYFILLCTLVPLVKINMWDINLSGNYRLLLVDLYF